MEASNGYVRPDGAMQAGLHRTAVTGLGETLTVMLATVGAAGVDAAPPQDKLTIRIAAAQPARSQNPACGELINLCLFEQPRQAARYISFIEYNVAVSREPSAFSLDYTHAKVQGSFECPATRAEG